MHHSMWIRLSYFTSFHQTLALYKRLQVTIHTVLMTTFYNILLSCATGKPEELTIQDYTRFNAI